MLPRTFPTLVKFELGHQFERGIGDILQAQLENGDYLVSRDVLCAVGGVVGHADFVAMAGAATVGVPDFVLEIKSTSFLRGKVPDEASPWYVEQAAIYALALGIDRFGILVGCRESGKLAPIFWFSLNEQHGDDAFTWREWATARANELVAVTNPKAPMPPADPRTGWACKTCPWAGCEKNPAYVDQSTLSKLEESYARLSG